MKNEATPDGVAYVSLTDLNNDRSTRWLALEVALIARALQEPSLIARVEERGIPVSDACKYVLNAIVRYREAAQVTLAGATMTCLGCDGYEPDEADEIVELVNLVNAVSPQGVAAVSASFDHLLMAITAWHRECQPWRAAA